MKAVTILGARPQFIKHASVASCLSGKVEDIIVHTGQHYDEVMSGVFFKDLGLKTPAYNLNVGSLSHAAQTGRMMEGIEKILLLEKPDCVLVYGDTNSTLAGALAAIKLAIPIAHIEAGLRSYNRQMPEEINRLIVDQISSLLFVPNEQSRQNLKNEGITQHVYVVGDVMIDLLRIWETQRSKSSSNTVVPERYFYVTLHRPYNTDNTTRLIQILECLNDLPEKVIFPAHPRTLSKLKEVGVSIERYSNIHLMPPQGYFENLNYIIMSQKVITDSGGVQKEAYVLGKPCITIRSETEWTETLIGNWNILCFEELDKLKELVMLHPDDKSYNRNVYGDGTAAKKIVDHILNLV